jgi:site-specific recombinase XerD
MKTFAEITPSFLAEVKISVKPRTYKCYEARCASFNRWIEDQWYLAMPLNKITPAIIAEFFVYLASEKGLDRSTCQKFFIELRRVFQYALKRNEIEKIPFDLVVFPPKGEDKSSQVLVPEHMKKLMDVIKQEDQQLHLACMTEFYCFIRPGTELRLLKVGDVDLENNTIRVIQEHAKNGHKRVVTVPTQLSVLLKEYGIETVDKDLYVFGNKKRPGVKPCSVNMLRWRFNKYRDELGLSKGYKLYSMKCSGASALHNSNQVSMLALMAQLGHSSLTSTQHYLKKYAGEVNTKIRDCFPDPY